MGRSSRWKLLGMKSVGLCLGCFSLSKAMGSQNAEPVKECKDEPKNLIQLPHYLLASHQNPGKFFSPPFSRSAAESNCAKTLFDLKTLKTRMPEHIGKLMKDFDAHTCQTLLPAIPRNNSKLVSVYSKINIKMCKASSCCRKCSARWRRKWTRR